MRWGQKGHSGELHTIWWTNVFVLQYSSSDTVQSFQLLCFLYILSYRLHKVSRHAHAELEAPRFHTHLLSYCISTFPQALQASQALDACKQYSREHSVMLFHLFNTKNHSFVKLHFSISAFVQTLSALSRLRSFSGYVSKQFSMLLTILHLQRHDTPFKSVLGLNTPANTARTLGSYMDLHATYARQIHKFYTVCRLQKLCKPVAAKVTSSNVQD